jgi:hypothetical protein
MRGRVVCGLVIASTLVVAGCGGSSHPSGAPVPSTVTPGRALLTRVLEVSNRVRTRFSSTIRFQVTDGGGGMTMHGSGVADLAAGLVEMTFTSSVAVPHLSQAGAPTFSAVPGADSHIVTRSRDYDRLVGPPSVAHDWCWTTPKRVPGPAVAPTATLATLVHKGATVTRVGTTVVRGVPTTHYVVTGSGRTSPVDIWVDSADQLRRIRWTQTGPTAIQTTTTDLFDFGVPVTIRTPTNAPACRP